LLEPIAKLVCIPSAFKRYSAACGLDGKRVGGKRREEKGRGGEGEEREAAQIRLTGQKFQVKVKTYHL
jgi:hypothetical protein